MLKRSWAMYSYSLAYGRYKWMTIGLDNTDLPGKGETELSVYEFLQITHAL
jgi:hypothetical protein